MPATATPRYKLVHPRNGRVYRTGSKQALRVYAAVHGCTRALVLPA